ncbi:MULTISPECIES: DUF4185 domain-containing protein [unclassified Crossiella]|uniref:DUF4185 domain-containing protein n=1 Tax=unclassified Crossiella TaxID=2620835 RepID=UPI0027E3C3F8|nr:MULTISPECIES: DUF4185 domain-containing protein [unclassified Crossiella]
MGTKRRVGAVLVTGLVLGLVSVVPAAAAPQLAEQVALVAGQGANDINRTRERFAVHATDLGIMWRDGRDRTAIMFGDTYGAGWGGHGAGPETADWRFNVLAHSTDTNLADGLGIDSMITDRPGHAAELLHRDPAVSEITVIPTAGVAAGNRDVVHYMSIKSWGPWTTNYSGLAYSDDGGRSWVKDPALRWSNSGGGARFQLGAFAKDGGYTYLFGTPNGRFGAAHLARVPEHRVLELGVYEYWTADGWQLGGLDRAIPVFGGQIGELSVQYNTVLRRWVALTLDESRAAIVLRTAPAPTGPWTGGRVVVRGTDHPALYGAFLHPDSARSNEIHFVMSQWGPYHSKLMRLRLDQSLPEPNLLSDGGFEDRPAGAAAGPWTITGKGGIDYGSGLAHTGANNAWVRETSGWHAVTQRLAVRPGQRYRLSGWLRSSATTTDGYFGVRRDTGVPAERKFGHLGDYTRLTVDFVADSAEIEVFGGTWALDGKDTWLQLDDFTLDQL